MGNSSDIINLIEIIKGKVTSDTDIVWTRYNSIDELKEDLDSLIQGVRNNDSSTFAKLKLLFAPTGSFQELSISNGWAKEFLLLSEKFDRLID